MTNDMGREAMPQRVRHHPVLSVSRNVVSGLPRTPPPRRARWGGVATVVLVLFASELACGFQLGAPPPAASRGVVSAPAGARRLVRLVAPSPTTFQYAVVAAPTALDARPPARARDVRRLASSGTDADAETSDDVAEAETTDDDALGTSASASSPIPEPGLEVEDVQVGDWAPANALFDADDDDESLGDAEALSEGEKEATRDLLAGFDLDAEDVGPIDEWETPRKLVCAEERRANRAKFARHDKDCGSSEVQIALFTARIKHITQHVIENPKDHASRRGLLALVSKRRRLLNYYYTKAPKKAEALAAELGVRFRFKSKLPSREEKYRSYTIEANRKRK